MSRDASGARLRTADGRQWRADQVVFACDSRAVVEMLGDATLLERAILSRFTYCDDTDPTFAEAVVHSDDSIITAAHRAEVLDGFNTYVRSHPGGLACTFVLSAKSPTFRDRDAVALVTFNAERPIDPQRVHARIPLPRANHALNLRNLMLMSAMPIIQGQRGLWYCGSYTTPEGGHDLSLLSGLVVAHTMGAPNPLGTDDPDQAYDFEQLRRLMMG